MAYSNPPTIIALPFVTSAVANALVGVNVLAPIGATWKYRIVHVALQQAPQVGAGYISCMLRRTGAGALPQITTGTSPQNPTDNVLLPEPGIIFDLNRGIDLVHGSNVANMAATLYIYYYVYQA